MATAGPGRGDSYRGGAVVFQTWNSCALLSSRELSGGGSADPTETPRSPPPFCESERHESLEKEELQGMRARGLLEMGLATTTVKCLVQIAAKCTQLETGCFMILSRSLLLCAFKSIDCFKLMKVLLSKGSFYCAAATNPVPPLYSSKMGPFRKRELAGVPT